MYTDEQFEQLEQEEHSLTEEALLVMLLSLNKTHADIETELRAFYSKYGRDGVVTYMEARKWIGQEDHRSRLSVLLLFITTRFNNLFGELKPEVTTLMSKIIDKESDFFDLVLDADDLLYDKWGVDEANWLKRLGDDVDLWGTYIGSDVKRGLLQRKTIDEVLEQLNKRFMSIERILERLAITESTAVNSIARKQIFKELGVKKYRFYAREDERTCEHCGALHGLVFPTVSYEVGVNASPIHPRCRCWEVPILE